MRRRRERGDMVFEAMIFLPIMFLLIVGMLRLAEITYLYYTLKKALYAAALYLSAQQGVDWCGDTTGQIAAAKNFAISGTTDGSLDPFLPNLTADMLDISPECFDPTTQTVSACVLSGCGGDAAVLQPDFLVVSIPSGYSINPRFPYILSQSIPLVPYVRVPFGGT